MSKKADKTSLGDFEQSLAKLEEIVTQLESQDLSLDNSIRSFEEGIKLAQQVDQQLKKAQQNVDILIKQMETESFNLEQD